MRIWSFMAGVAAALNVVMLASCEDSAAARAERAEVNAINALNRTAAIERRVQAIEARLRM